MSRSSRDFIVQSSHQAILHRIGNTIHRFIGSIPFDMFSVPNVMTQNLSNAGREFRLRPESFNWFPLQSKRIVT